MTVQEQVRQVLSDPLSLPPEFLDYLVQYAAINPVPVGAVRAAIVNSTGGGFGYATGAGGSVTQATSKSTAVILNTRTGQITMNNAALAGGASVTFTLNNSAVANTDVVTVNPVGTVAAGGNYRAEVAWTTGAVGAQTIGIRVTNVSGGSLSEALILQFSILDGASS